MITPKFDMHVFVCTNERIGTNKLSCGEAHGLALVAEFKKQFKELNSGLNTRVTKSGCLGICDLGPTVAIYPEGVFHVDVKTEDIKQIIELHSSKI